MHDSFSMKFKRQSENQPLVLGVGGCGYFWCWIDWENAREASAVRNILYLVIQAVRILVYAYGKIP